MLAAELAADQPLPQAPARYTARRRPAVGWVQDAADRLATGPSRQQRMQQEDSVWLHATAQALQRQQRPPTLTD